MAGHIGCSELAAGTVQRQELPAPFPALAIAAGAGALDHDPLVRTALQRGWFRIQLGDLAVIIDQQIVAARTGIAAMHAPRLIEEALARPGEDAAMSQRADHPPQGQASPVLAGTPAVLRQAVFLDEQREFRLHDLV